MGKKLSIENVILFLEDNDDNNECELLSTEYINSRSPLLLKCNLCGNTFERDFEHLKRKRFCCRNCGSKKGGAKQSLGIKGIKQYMLDHNIDSSCLISTSYTNNRTPLEFKCKDCGKHYFQTWEKFTQSVYHNCPSCSHKPLGFQKKYTQQEVQEIIQQDKYILLGTYINTHTPVLCQCKNGHQFNLSFTHYLIDGRGCPQCFRDYYRGENVTQWKGGITPIAHILRHSADSWRKKILVEGQYKCDITGNTEDLEVHHLNTNFSSIVEQAFKNTNIEIKAHIKDYTNEELRQLKDEVQKLHNDVKGIILAKDLHSRFHQEFGYQSNTEYQYNQFKAKILNEIQEE